MQTLLLRYTPDIVHFAGHGTENSGIILEDEQGLSYPVSTSALKQLFSLFGERIKCVILNTVYSEATANVIAESVDYVIGMRGSVSDEVAINFSTSFYQALGYGKDVETAFQLGLLAIKLSSPNDNNVPVLISKSRPALVFTEDSTAEELHEVGTVQKRDNELSKTTDPTTRSYQNILGKRKTLGVFVGVNTYDDPFISNLTVCVDDVSAVYNAFGEDIDARLLCTGSDISSVPSRNNIFNQLLISSRAAEEIDLLLFYYSGHGFAVDGQSYLVATDSRYSALKYTAVAMQDVIEIMQSSEARAKIIIIDACHSGAAIGKSAPPPLSEEFIENIFRDAEGTAILSSCRQGEKSWEWPDKNCSVFTYYLLNAIGGRADVENKGFITISETYKFLTHSLKIWSKRNGLSQTPTMRAEVVGDIVLARVNSNSSKV